jgi:aminomethyltransferase
MVYDVRTGDQAGYATTLMYSPVLQQHIGMARVRPAYAAPGSEVHVEITIDHAYQRVLAHTARMPLFRPERKTA